jgi:lysophospholipase L1-like esterase
MAFEELLDEFEKSKIEVIFVQVPGYLPARDGLNIEESMELINEIAEKRRILFLDYETKRMTDINTDPSMFSDWIHLNEKGSDAFSKLLKSDLESLLRQGFIEEKRLSAPRRLSDEKKSPVG